MCVLIASAEQLVSPPPHAGALTTLWIRYNTPQSSYATTPLSYNHNPNSYDHTPWPIHIPLSDATPRDIERLPTAPFSLVLRKEYFDYPQRDSHTQYITFNRGESGESVLLHSAVLQPWRSKSTPLWGRTSTHILHLSGHTPYTLASMISNQCCGSRMFIPDPTFFHPGSRIRIKEFKYFKPKNGSGSRIRVLTFNPSRIPEPGSRGQKGTGSRDPDPQHW